MSRTVALAAELGCEEMVTFILRETDLTVGWDPTSDKGITMQIETQFDGKTESSAALWIDAKTARRIARALLVAADQCSPAKS